MHDVDYVALRHRLISDVHAHQCPTRVVQQATRDK
jgi:hypothetical protein